MEDPQRPLPPRSLVDRVRSWTEWIGYGRIAGSALAMMIVCAGGYWLMRMPPPPTEASLPLASTSTAAPPVPAPAETSMVATATSAAVSAGGAMHGEGAGVDGAGGDGAPAPTVVVVHVAGAVVAPGVYELPAGSRTERALTAAGGPVAGADPNALNLAAPLVDGSRIYVPLLGEVVPPTSVPPGSPVGGIGRANGSGGEATGPINVNQASAADLEELPGVGPATAAAIVSERDRNGPFLSVDDLDRVPGIGPTKIEALRDLVTT